MSRINRKSDVDQFLIFESTLISSRMTQASIPFLGDFFINTWGAAENYNKLNLNLDNGSA